MVSREEIATDNRDVSTKDGIVGNGTKGERDKYLTIQKQIQTSLQASKVFFENDFDHAVDLCKQGMEKSLYHTLSYATLSWMKAWMTFEKPEIETAIEALKISLEFSNNKKRRAGWFDYLHRANYDDYTEEEVHAELAYADSVFMLSLITFIQDQNFMSLIKGAYRFRCGFQSYKLCSQILEKRTKWETENTKREFESGVRAGNGSYNLALSISPPRVLRILEFMGFSGDRGLGINELRAAANLEDTGRSAFATIMLLMNFMYTETMTGWGDKDWSIIDYLLDCLSKSCPKSVFRPLFQGKYQQLKGNCEEAIKLMHEAIRTQDQWKQLHNACNWEIMWCYAIQCKWSEAAEYADRMRKESLWSPCTFTYQNAAYLYMLKEQSKDASLDGQIAELIREVPKLKRRLAGKSTPREKFVCKMAERYEQTNGKLVAPGFEVLYIWNIFSAINSPHLIRPILATLEDDLKPFTQENNNNEKIVHDDWGVLYLLKGVCLRHLNRLQEAVDCFHKVLDQSSYISSGHYLLPTCNLELGLAYMKLHNKEKAKDYLRRSINNYTKYSGELIVHVRAHFALKLLQDS